MDGGEPTVTVASEWRRCRPWIEAALDRGGGLYSIEDVEQFIANGEAFFWPGVRCAAVTQFIGRRNVALNFWLLGGDLSDLLNNMRPAIEAWAKEQGCTRVMGVFGEGRRGWQRVLAKHGYSHFSTALGKDL